MTAFEDRSSPTLVSSMSRTTTAPWLWCLAVVGFAIVWQYLLWGVNSDTSWIITMCERVLAGERLYIDIIETNPPMTLWMYMPVVMFARLIGISPEVAIMGYFYLVCVGGLAFASYIAWKADFPENRHLYAMLPVFLVLLIVLPAYAFSQREQFGIALLLPLLTLMAWRITADRQAQPAIWLAVAAGLCGSMIVLVKPYYAVMIAVPALYVAWRKGSIRWLFTAEYWTILCVCTAYLAAVMLIYPEYMQNVYPALADVYIQDRIVARTIQIYGILYAPIVYLFYRLRPGAPTPPLITLVMISSIAGLFPLVYQSKAWPYHALPAFMLGLGAVTYRIWQPDGGPAGLKGIFGKIVIVLAFVLGTWPFTLTNKTSKATVETVRDSITRPTVGLIGEGIQVGHPFTRMVDGVFVGKYCSDWLGASAFALAAEARAAGDEARASHYDDVVRNHTIDRARELASAPPQVLLLQKRSDWVALFLRDPVVAELMNRYHLISEDESGQVFLRTAG